MSFKRTTVKHFPQFQVCNCVSQNNFCDVTLRNAITERLERTVGLVKKRFEGGVCDMKAGGVSFTETRPWHKASDAIPVFLFGVFKERYQRGLDILNDGFAGVSWNEI